MHRRLAAAVVIVAGCLGIPGCSVWSYAWRVSVTERRLFCEEEDDEISLATYRAWADQAWAETRACCPDNCTRADYIWGFREGFSQYVYAGGSGDPPGMPPRPYWNAGLRSPEGAAAAASWFEGYRHGARVAREGGYRELTTLKLSGSLRDCTACGCPDKHTGSCPITTTAPTVINGPALEGPGVIPPPSEVVIPLEVPAGSDPAPSDDSVLTPPSLETGATSMPVFTSPTFKPAAAQAAGKGRVQTALFQIVR